MKTPLRIEPVPVEIHPQERFLEYIPGIGDISQHSRQPAEQPALMPLHQAVQCLSVSTRKACHVGGIKRVRRHFGGRSARDIRG
jgi:hypothetical protein